MIAAASAGVYLIVLLAILWLVLWTAKDEEDEPMSKPRPGTGGVPTNYGSMTLPAGTELADGTVLTTKTYVAFLNQGGQRVIQTPVALKGKVI